MKMNTLVTATTSGSVSTINVGAGDMVEEGQALLSVD
jgi:biotin carboxyl carrier protein